MINKNKLLIMVLGFWSLVYSPMSLAAHGYLVFWREPNIINSLPHTKTTQEDISKEEAENEKNEFCAEQNARLFQNNQINMNNVNGCFGETYLENTCVAAAFASHHNQVLNPKNLFIKIGNNIPEIQQLAINQCEQEVGETGACELATTYCTDKDLYQY